MNTYKVMGVVFSGEKLGGTFVGITWAKRQIEEKLGFSPYLGTLNIRLSETQAKQLKKILKKSKGVKITPAKGFVKASCFSVLIMNKIRGAIVIPEKLDYPSNVLEILAPVHLRKAFALRNGDKVEITFLSGSSDA